MSFCGLSLLRTGSDAMTVVITELPGNPGTPVADFFENLATLLFESQIVFLKVPPEGIVWVEHLPNSAGPGGHTVREVYSQVMLEWDGKRYHSPKRVPIPRDAWRDFSSAEG